MREMFDFILAVILIFVIVTMFILTLGYFAAIPSVRIFNEFNGTSYTAWGWLWAEGTIKDYVTQGKQQTINLNLKKQGGENE